MRDSDADLDAGHWVFGYGSLIWKVDFPWCARQPAWIEGWVRRFWQGSHDHRGRPDAPGRVVTLVPAAGVRCPGVAYRISAEVFLHLDRREQNGYARRDIRITLAGGCEVPGTVYVADPGNPAYLGEANETDIAREVARASGPSGSNRDYLLQLAAALRRLGADDPHVFAIERALGEATEATGSSGARD